MSASLKIIQYRALQQTSKDIYIVIRSGRYVYFTGVGTKKTSELYDLNEGFQIRLTTQPLEIEVWDYWKERDSQVGRGQIDTNQKLQLMTVKVVDGKRAIVGELIVHLTVEQEALAGSFNIPSQTILSGYSSSFNEILQPKLTDSSPVRMSHKNPSFNQLQSNQAQMLQQQHQSTKMYY